MGKQEKMREDEERERRRKEIMNGVREPEIVKEKPAAPKAKPEATPPATTETAMVPVEPKAAPQAASAPNAGQALQGFLDDHPEFMRVLQNPKKCLSDPRVKSMFIRELENYPVVKSFLATKGLVFKS